MCFVVKIYVNFGEYFDNFIFGLVEFGLLFGFGFLVVFWWNEKGYKIC